MPEVYDHHIQLSSWNLLTSLAVFYFWTYLLWRWARQRFDLSTSKLIMVRCVFTMAVTNIIWRNPAGNIVRP